MVVVMQPTATGIFSIISGPFDWDKIKNYFKLDKPLSVEGADE